MQLSNLPTSRKKFIFTAIFFLIISIGNADKFDDIVEQNRNAINDLSNDIKRALGDEWCSSLETCNSSPCLYNACSGNFASPDTIQCRDGPAPANCARRDGQNDGTEITYEEKCASSDNTDGVQVSDAVPNMRITTDRVRSIPEENAPINITNIDSKRDVCAIASIASKFKPIFQRYDASHLYYVATRNKAFVQYPGLPACRFEKPFVEDPFSSCKNFDPTIRPWYITATSGPRDVVFVIDRSILATRSPLLDVIKGTKGENLYDNFDSRDHLAVVLYDTNSSEVLPTNEPLLRKKGISFSKDMADALDMASSSSSSGSLQVGMKKAFEILQNAEQTGPTGRCSKYIVVMQTKADSCFDNCRSSTNRRCTCVGDIVGFVNEKQGELNDPAAILAVTESREDEEDYQAIGYLESLAGSLACSGNRSGLWHQYDESDFQAKSLPVLGQYSAVAQIENSQTLYSSGLYEDFYGYGQIFTLARPIYGDGTGLAAVVGVDITLESVTIDSDTESARKRVEEFSATSRDCPAVQTNGGCDFQRLRQQYGRECPATPRTPKSCFRFGTELFYKTNERSAFDLSITDCGNSFDSAIAKIDTPDKNERLSGIYDLDGSWIGIRAEIGETFRWSDGSTVNKTLIDEQFEYDASNALVPLQQRVNGPVCITADRRGTTKNWNLVPCSEQHSAICLVLERNGDLCNGIFDLIQLNQDPRNPIKCSKRYKECSEAQNEFEKIANPVCPQTGVDKSDIDRSCCGSTTQPPLPTETPSSSPDPGTSPPPIGLIVGVASGVLGIIILIVVIYYLYKNRRNQTRRTDNPGGNNANQSSNPDNPDSTENGTGGPDPEFPTVFANP